LEKQKPGSEGFVIRSRSRRVQSLKNWVTPKAWWDFQRLRATQILGVLQSR